MSTAGEIAYPGYIQGFHSYALMDTAADGDFAGTLAASMFFDDTNALEEMVTLQNAAPYANQNTYDPDTELEATEDEIGSYRAFVEGIDPEDTWSDFVDTALSQVGRLVDPGDVEGDVDAFRIKSETSLARSYARVSATFSDINAVVSTAYPTSLALLEMEHNDRVAEFASSRQSQASQDRSKMAALAIGQLTALFSAKMQAKAGTVTFTDSFNRMKIAAKTDQTLADLALDIDETLWDWSILQRGTNLIGAMQGISTVPTPLTQTQKLLGGFATAVGLGFQFASADEDLGKFFGENVGAFAVGGLLTTLISAGNLLG